MVALAETTINDKNKPDSSAYQVMPGLFSNLITCCGGGGWEEREGVKAHP